MALTDLNRPKLKKYSPKGMMKKGANVSGWSYGKSGKRSPYKSNFGRSSNDPWLLEYSGPEKKKIIYLGGPIMDMSGYGINKLQYLKEISTKRGVANKFGLDISEDFLGEYGTLDSGRYNRQEFIERHLSQTEKTGRQNYTGSPLSFAEKEWERYSSDLKKWSKYGEQHRSVKLQQTAYNDATRMMDYLSKRIASIGDKLNPLYDKNLTSADIPGLKDSLESWTRKQQQAEDTRGFSLEWVGDDRARYTTTGGIFFGSQLQDIGERLGGTFYLNNTLPEYFNKQKGYWNPDTDYYDKQLVDIVSNAELGGFRKNLAEKFNKKGEIFNSFFDPNIKFVEVPKRHKPSTVNYFTDHDAMGFTKNMEIGKDEDSIISKFIGISEGGTNYKYPNTLKLNLGMPGNTNDDILAKSYFPGPPMGSEELHATGFTKFFIDKTKSQFVGISKDGKSYKYPVVVGPHQETFRLGRKEGRTVTGLGNTDSSVVGVDYFSGEPGKWGNIGGESGTHTVPLGFWKNIGKEDVSDLPYHSRSFLTRFSNKDGTGPRVFSLGPPTEADPLLWQLSSKSIIPGVPNTWNVHGQTMWDQRGEGDWDAGNQPSLQWKGVNFMAGTKKGKTFNPDQDLHPYGFTTNMGYIGTGVAAASRLAIPIDENGDITKLKISANLDGMDEYDFPYPGQGSWHIRKHWNRRHFPPKNKSGHVAEGFYDLNVPDSQENYPIWSNMNLEATKETAKKASESLNINEDSENITKLNTLIGASTYKVPRIGSEIARKFLHPTAIENSENKFSYIDHYWRWKTPEQIREEAAPGKMQKDQIHPIIYKSLIDMEGGNKETFRYSGDTDRTQGSRPTIEFIRGGVITSINRIKADKHRLKTIMTHGDKMGWGFSAKQFVLQLLNPREETRLWNPLSILAGASRVVKLQRHLSVEGLLNSIQSNKYIQMFTDPGNISPASPGLYEIAEGYDKWDGDGKRNTGNKLSQWATDSFETDDTSDMDKLGKRLGSFLKKSILSNLDPTGLTKKLLDGDGPDPPSRYVNSQKLLKGSGKVNVAGDDGSMPGYRFATLDYDKLHKLYSYSTTLMSAGEHQNFDDNTTFKGPLIHQQLNKEERKLGSGIVDDIGHQGHSEMGAMLNTSLGLGLTSHPFGNRVDKINAFPRSTRLPDERIGDQLPYKGGPIKDFVKFRFKDMVNNKYLVFRAILSGINDNITPEWSSERYIGRADQVHVYRGADRNISFNFSIAPKSKVELPILMEKLNYLIGLCYPEYDKNNSNRMVPPMTQLTIGSILNEAPGFLNSLSYTVEENSPWEIQEGMQFPKFINVSCDFRYIGHHLPHKEGMHLGTDINSYKRLMPEVIPPSRPDIPGDIAIPAEAADELEPLDYIEHQWEEKMELQDYTEWDPLPTYYKSIPGEHRHLFYNRVFIDKSGNEFMNTPAEDFDAVNAKNMHSRKWWAENKMIPGLPEPIKRQFNYAAGNQHKHNHSQKGHSH